MSLMGQSRHVRDVCAMSALLNSGHGDDSLTAPIWPITILVALRRPSVRVFNISPVLGATGAIRRPLVSTRTAGPYLGTPLGLNVVGPGSGMA